MQLNRKLMGLLVGLCSLWAATGQATIHLSPLPLLAGDDAKVGGGSG